MAQTVHILCESAKAADVKAILFLETTAIGVRSYEVEKTALERELVPFSIDGLALMFKRVMWEGEFLKYKIESESIATYAQEREISLLEAQRQLSRYLEEDEKWRVLKVN